MSELNKEINEIEQIDEGWFCKNDADAEWCMQKIKEAEEEKASWKEHFKKQFDSIAETADQTIDRMMHYLREYFKLVPHKITKKEENYRLKTGKLVLKKQNPEYQRDEKELIAWLKANDGSQFVKTKEFVDWDELKKTLTVVGESVADENGVFIPCITVIEKDPEFKIGK